MAPRKSNASRQALIQNYVDIAVKAIRQNKGRTVSQQQPNTDIAFAIATATNSVLTHSGDDGPSTWLMLSPEYAIYHGVAAELDGFYGTSSAFGDQTIGQTLVKQKEYLREGADRLKKRIAELEIEQKEREQFVQSSKKRCQRLALPMHKDAEKFHRNSQYAVSARLHWCRSEREMLELRSKELNQRERLKRQSRQLTQRKVKVFSRLPVFQMLSAQEAVRGTNPLENIVDR